MFIEEVEKPSSERRFFKKRRADDIRAFAAGELNSADNCRDDIGRRSGDVQTTGG